MQYMIYRLTVTGQSISSMLMLVAALSLLLVAVLPPGQTEELYWSLPRDQWHIRELMYMPDYAPDGRDENRVIPILLTNG